MTNRNLLGLTVLCAFGVVCLAACQQAPVEEPPAAGPPFSPSIEVDDTLYLSGQVGLDPETREMASGIQAETKVTMENLKRELEAKGYGFSDVVASHVWMTDISQIGQMSEIYRSFFEGDKLPSRTTVAISKLALGATVEIAMVAVRGEKQYVYPEGTEPGKAPYSPGVLAGDRLFVSGQAGVIPGTLKLVEGDIKAHVTQTLKNIETCAEGGGHGFLQRGLDRGLHDQRRLFRTHERGLRFHGPRSEAGPGSHSGLGHSPQFSGRNHHDRQPGGKNAGAA